MVCGEPFHRNKAQLAQGGGKFCSIECRRKIGWNRPETKALIAASLRQLMKNPEARRKYSHPQSQETKNKIAKAMKKWRATSKGREDAKMAGRISFQKTGLLQRFHNKRPTQPEKEFIRINQVHDLGFKYNGDYREKISFGNKIPDFVNVESKIIVEVFSYYYHCPIYYVNVKYHQTEEGTIKHYANYGYRCLVLWQRINHRDLEMPVEQIILRLKGLLVHG